MNKVLSPIFFPLYLWHLHSRLKAIMGWYSGSWSTFWCYRAVAVNRKSWGRNPSGRTPKQANGDYEWSVAKECKMTCWRRGVENQKDGSLNRRYSTVQCFVAGLTCLEQFLIDLGWIYTRGGGWVEKGVPWTEILPLILSNVNHFALPQNLMEIQTYVSILQQIMQTTPRVSTIAAGASEVSVLFHQQCLWHAKRNDPKDPLFK